MHWPIVELDFAVFIEPAKAMFEPVLIVPFREILARMSPATFRPAYGRLDADARLRKHVVEFKRLGQIRVEHRRAIRDVKIGAHHLDDAGELCRAPSSSGPVRNTAQCRCMVRCISSLIAPAPVPPFDHLMRSNRPMARSVAASGAGA